MSTSALGSTFEISLRILVMLNEVQCPLDEQQIVAVDFISVYAADFGLLDENLHGYSNYRFSEFPARKYIVSSALKDLVLDCNVQLRPTSAGYMFSITDKGKNLCRKLTSTYAGEYRIAVRTMLNKFENANAKLMTHEINRLTVQSLKEVGHE